ncbi:MAG TPA: hypothetical protein VGJ20_34555, partial [Xanthobacteraceae bacterium]
MNWFRSKMRSLVRLALGALALQMAVCFGHVHRDELGLPPLAAAGETHFATGMTHVPAEPAGQDHHSTPNDYCPLCASMALVATGMTSLPPVLIVPAPIPRVWAV